MEVVDRFGIGQRREIARGYLLGPPTGFSKEKAVRMQLPTATVKGAARCDRAMITAA